MDNYSTNPLNPITVMFINYVITILFLVALMKCGIK